MSKTDNEHGWQWIIHAIVGGLIGVLTMLFVFFVVFGLGDFDRFRIVTASQHPYELPLYVMLCGFAGSCIYWGLICVLKLIRRKHTD